MRFLEEVKRGEAEVRAPVYSHVVYDIVDGEEQVLARARHRHPRGPQRAPDRGLAPAHDARFVSDWFDFSIYVDADEADIEQWYVERFFALRETAFNDETSFFRHFAALVRRRARRPPPAAIWASINRPNLRENILPSRMRADLVLEKGADHGVRQVRLRLRLTHAARPREDGRMRDWVVGGRSS